MKSEIEIFHRAMGLFIYGYLRDRIEKNASDESTTLQEVSNVLTWYVEDITKHLTNTKSIK